MHGRLKVRTTEEERERKKKEQALKVRAYIAAMTKIQTKRQKEEYDDEMLQLTMPILQRNPDVFSLFNIRRQCIERKSTDPEITTEALQKVYDTELNITEQCLMVNPKSYAAWHHRCWSLEHSPSANWQQEMRLCTKYLKMDERNLHTWNYRRYVAQKAGIGNEKELDFCTEKIKANFSNYSSWHYRSILLPTLYPYEGDALPKRPMSEEKLKEELEMVLSAAFTDPNDSSAWFYQRWLLGYNRPALDVCAFRLDGEKAVIAFTKPILGDKSIKVVVQSEDRNIETLTEWYSVQKTEADAVWCCKVPNSTAFDFDKDTKYAINVNIPNLETINRNLKQYQNSYYYIQAPNPTVAYTPDVLTELQTQLDSCNSLLEFEPESKWTLLTSSLLLRAIDRVKHHDQSLEYLQKLKKVDALREGYYNDLASKWILEKLLTDWIESENVPRKFSMETANNLTSIDYGQYFAIADEITLPKDLEKKYSNSLKIMTFKALNSSIKDN